MPNVTRGGSSAGLMMYLFGKGDANEHTDQHVIAGDAGTVARFGGEHLDRDGRYDLANHLDAPMQLWEREVVVPDRRWDPEKEEHVRVGDKPAHVWHCSLSLRAEEGQLTDEQWSTIANEFVSEMGFSTDDPNEAGCRWVAVRHGLSKRGNDHIHIAVNLVREDGTIASTHKDFARAQSVAGRLEERHGLAVTAGRQRSSEALAGASKAESARVDSGQRRHADRDELRRRLRSAAAHASNEREFIEGARDLRVLVRPRFAKGGTSEVVGYSAALTPAFVDGKRGEPVWFSGAKLDSNLSLGQLRARWPDNDQAAAVPAWKERGRAARTGAWDTPQRASAPAVPPAMAARLAVLGTSGAKVGRYAATELSGAFASASLYFEKNTHGPLANASSVFAKAAAMPKWRADKPDAKPGARSRMAADSIYAVRLAMRAGGRSSSTGWRAVMRQADRSSKLMASQLQQAGNTRMATEILGSVKAALSQFEKLSGETVGELEHNAETETQTPRAPRRTPGISRDNGIER